MWLILQEVNTWLIVWEVDMWLSTRSQHVTYNTMCQHATHNTRNQRVTSMRSQRVTYSTRSQHVTYSTRCQRVTYSTRCRRVTCSTRNQRVTYSTKVNMWLIVQVNMWLIVQVMWYVFSFSTNDCTLCVVQWWYNCCLLESITIWTPISFCPPVTSRGIIRLFQKFCPFKCHVFLSLTSQYKIYSTVSRYILIDREFCTI